MRADTCVASASTSARSRGLRMPAPGVVQDRARLLRQRLPAGLGNQQHELSQHLQQVLGNERNGRTEVADVVEDHLHRHLERGVAGHEAQAVALR